MIPLTMIPLIWLCLFPAALVPIASPAQRTKLSAPLPPGPSRGAVVDFRASPDGSRMVYLADQDADEVFELYACPADGGAAALRLNAPLDEGEAIHGFEI